MLPGWWAYEARDTASGLPVYHTAACIGNACPGGALQQSVSASAPDPSSPSPLCDFPRRDSPDNWLCADCASGYLPWGSSCDACRGSNPGLLVGVFVAAFAFVGFLLYNGVDSTGHVSILLFFAQTAALEIGPTSRSLGWMQIVNPGAKSVSTCLAPLTPLQQMLLTLLVPFIFAGVLAVIVALHLVARAALGGGRSASSDPLRPNLAGSSSEDSALPPSASFAVTVTAALRSFQPARYVSCLVAIGLSCYTSVSVAAIDGLHCVAVAPGVSRLYAAPSVDCGAGAAAYEQFRPVAAAFLALVVAAPLAMLAFLWSHRSLIGHNPKEHLVAHDVHALDAGADVVHGDTEPRGAAVSVSVLRLPRSSSATPWCRPSSCGGARCT